METLQEDIIKLSSGARKQLLILTNQEENYPERILRIGVEGGGCAGLSYILQFDQKTENDILLNIDGINLIMNKAHGLYLSGITVDYQEGLNARGFTFQNPNAQTTCGCGSSFGI